MAHHQLDARRLLCPMPVIRTQNFVVDLPPGDTVEVFCTDHGALNDIPAWCRINGHEVIASRTGASGEVVVTVRVGAKSD